ncbi:MAG TPA: hypothetical protein VGC30_12875, partial [Dokdonella sp.]
MLQPFLGDPMQHPVVGSDVQFAYATSRLDDAVSLEEFVAGRYPAQLEAARENRRVVERRSGPYPRRRWRGSPDTWPSTRARWTSRGRLRSAGGGARTIKPGRRRRGYARRIDRVPDGSMAAAEKALWYIESHYGADIAL